MSICVGIYLVLTVLFWVWFAIVNIPIDDDTCVIIGVFMLCSLVIGWPIILLTMGITYLIQKKRGN